ncbi:hypothetical protein [Burkholderia ubonensis]|uniref:ParB/Spo0J HTH domain-containing protein n=1 Tax=Burkholderia ubonensis TaxID=101571 RepID=A0ABD4E3K0_9BURK|nr:hypothetical protein [Burkholderia ubonensis]KVN83479.1 hypothetical protein WJ68_16335 [Burkholderia ubonensis]
MSNLVSLKKIAEDKTQTEIGIKKVTHFGLDPRAISIKPGLNGRDMVNLSPRTRAHINAIKAAIRAGDTLPPLDVRIEGDKIYVVEGHCRLIAYRELLDEGMEIKFVDVRQFIGSDEECDFHVLNSASQLHLTRLEQGRKYKQRASLGWTPAQIAERVRKSVAYVEQNLMLANADSDVQRMLEAETVTVKAALAAIRKHGTRAGTVLAGKLEQVMAAGQSSVTEKAMRSPTLKPAAAEKVRASIDTLFGRMSADARQQIASAADDTEIRVSARFLKEMLQAHEEANKSQAPKKQKKATKEVADAAA